MSIAEILCIALKFLKSSLSKKNLQIRGIFKSKTKTKQTHKNFTFVVPRLIFGSSITCPSKEYNVEMLFPSLPRIFTINGPEYFHHLSRKKCKNINFLLLKN